jgi:type VI secretion system protein ImpK
MTPQFSAAVDPIIVRVIALMDRVEKSEATTPQSERQSLETLFREAEGQLTDSAAWNLAKYALACWIDDLLASSPWHGNHWWENNSLEFALFRTHDRATMFFIRAKEAAELTRRDALEVFYLCVILGFRGLYRLPEREMVAEQLHLPMTIGGWAKESANAIKMRPARPPIQEVAEPPSGAPPLESRYLAVSAAIVTVILLMLQATLWYVQGMLEASG